jgi:hypothetical protein
LASIIQFPLVMLVSRSQEDAEVGETCQNAHTRVGKGAKGAKGQASECTSDRMFTNTPAFVNIRKESLLYPTD